MTSRELDYTVSKANVQAAVEQFLRATKAVHDDEDVVNFGISYNEITDTYNIVGNAEKKSEVLLN